MLCCATARGTSLRFTGFWVSAQAVPLWAQLRPHRAAGCVTLTSCFLTGDREAAAAYERAAALRLEAIESVLWDAERGAWFDYSLVTHSRHLDFYASNLAPLWARCYSQPEMGEKAVQYLKVGG